MLTVLLPEFATMALLAPLTVVFIVSFPTVRGGSITSPPA
jgi:hypothetical protein